MSLKIKDIKEVTKVKIPPSGVGRTFTEYEENDDRWIKLLPATGAGFAMLS